MAKSISHDTLFTQLGYTLSAWTGVETAVSEYFMALNKVQWHEYSHPLRASFESVINFEVRVAMIDAFINADNSIPPDYLPLFNSLKNKLSKKYKSRHKIAHFKMQVDWNRVPPKPVIMPFYKMSDHMTQNQEMVSVEYIEEQKASFLNLHRRVGYHSDYICQMKGLPTQWPEPKGGLLQAIQAPPG